MSSTGAPRFPAGLAAAHVDRERSIVRSSASVPKVGTINRTRTTCSAEFVAVVDLARRKDQMGYRAKGKMRLRVDTPGGKPRRLVVFWGPVMARWYPRATASPGTSLAAARRGAYDDARSGFAVNWRPVA